jgi:hypothetical protein
MQFFGFLLPIAKPIEIVDRFIMLYILSSCLKENKLCSNYKGLSGNVLSEKNDFFKGLYENYK